MFGGNVKAMRIIFLLLVVSSSLSADSPAPPESFTKLSPDRKHILVILAPKPYDVSNSLSKKYPISGLYVNDSSVKPLWSLPSDFCCSRVDILSNAKNLISWNAWPADNGTFDQTVAWFFENGREIRNYKIRQLVDNPEHLRHSVSHYRWIDRTEVDDRLNRITLRTLNGQIIVFDGTTGEVISRARTSRYYRSFVTCEVILFLFLVGIVTTVVIIKKRRSKRSAHQNPF